MEADILLGLLDRIPDGPRVTARHISLYLALFCQADLSSLDSPIRIKKEVLMEKAKISGRPTYFRCLKDLHELGYIRYVPAGHRHTQSLAYLSWGTTSPK